MKLSALLVLAALFFATGARSAKILAVFHFNSKSHFVMLEALAKGLAEKGHKVTVVSHFPRKTSIPNYEDISLEGTAESVVNNVSVQYILEEWRPFRSCLDFVWRKAGVDFCDRMYRAPAIRKLITSGESYDLLITELWASDCFLPLANVFDVPHISMTTFMEFPWGHDRYYSPWNPAYQVSSLTSFSPFGLTFWERLLNSIVIAYMKVGYYLYSEIPSSRIVRKYLGDSVPHLSDVVRNSSLVFVNTHFSSIGPRPLQPNVVEVGGLHIPEPRPVPADLKEFLDEAAQGVILWSLGSLIRAETLGDNIIDSFLSEFAKLPLRVLWKFNGTVKNQPANVKTMSWLPQSDVLRHPNVKLFITHGGLMGTQEAVTAGVPMLGVPFFADQRFNLLVYQEKGFAIKMELEEINEESVHTAIREILSNPKYRENAKLHSELFRDRPQTALETAIYWTEYVIRHKGARHLKSPAADLDVFQYFLADVALFLGTVAFAVVRCVAFCCRGRKRDTKAN